jgi:MATE family multidrug resistance protein
LITLKEINRLAIPAILYNITEPLIGLVDTAIIGGMEAHPTEAQGGVGLAAGLFSLLVWSLAQLRTAVSAITSQYYGKGDLDFIKPLIPQALFISFLLGVGFWAGTSLWYTEICTFLYDKSDALTLTFSTEYYTIRSLGLPLALLVACFFGIFRGMQNTTWAMVISLVGGAVNLVLDLILVHGIEGVIPAYGVAGAAWASFVAQAVMTL